MKRLRITTEKGPVSAVLDEAAGARTVVVLAPGAGSDLRTPFLDGAAEGLAGEGVSCLRFNFPYREAGRRAPDPERVLRTTWRAAFERAGQIAPTVWVGGKSMGGRIASMEVADGMPAAGLVFLGYPLHPPGKPERLRDAHLYRIEVPMLFVQGTRDPFARWDLLEPVIARLGNGATLHAVEGGDHSFRVRGEPKDDTGIGRRLGEMAARFVADRG